MCPKSKVGGHALLGAFVVLSVGVRQSPAQEYRYDPVAAATYAATNWNSQVVRYGVENPFTNYGHLTPGGNCTNFVSQSIMGGLVRSYKPVVVFQNRRLFVADRGSSLSWYFISDADRAMPAWAGADGLYRYAVGNAPQYKGLHFSRVPLDSTRIGAGDIIFADWDNNGSKDHSMIVTSLTGANGFNRIRLTYQSNDRTDVGFGDLITQKRGASFAVFRPVNYTTMGR